VTATTATVTMATVNERGATREGRRRRKAASS
jgi:hypothetical protein